MAPIPNQVSPVLSVAAHFGRGVQRVATDAVFGRFYSELSPELSGVPRSYGSAFDPLTGRFVLLLEDLAVEPCDFPDTLHPLTTAQAGLIVELLARLHGTFWGRLPRRSGDGPLGWLNAASAGLWTGRRCGAAIRGASWPTRWSPA